MSSFRSLMNRMRNDPNIGSEERGRLGQEYYRILRNTIFRTVAKECFLKNDKLLPVSMIFMLSPSMINNKLIRANDICTLCPKTACSFNISEDPRAGIRIFKIKIISWLLNKPINF